MHNISRLFTQLLAFIGGALRLVWRLALGLLGLGVVLGLVSVGLLVWLVARLLGKKPQPVNLRWQQHMGRHFRPGREGQAPFGFGRPRRPASAEDVVDVQARELQPAPPNVANAPNTPAAPGALPGPREPSGS